jgi:hypothetical protein
VPGKGRLADIGMAVTDSRTELPVSPSGSGRLPRSPRLAAFAQRGLAWTPGEPALSGIGPGRDVRPQTPTASFGGVPRSGVVIEGRTVVATSGTVALVALIAQLIGPLVTLARGALVAITGGLIILVGCRLARFRLVALHLAISRAKAAGRLLALRRVHRAQIRVRLPRPRTSVVRTRLGVATTQPHALRAWICPGS